MVTTTGSHPKAQWPGVKAWFGTTYKDKPIVANRVFDQYSSDKGWEEFVENTGFGLAPVKPQGDSISYDTNTQGYTSRIVNVTYGLGAKVTMEAIADNQYWNVARKKSGMLARSMRHTRETVFANILNRGFDSNFVGGDGVELFSTAHPTLFGNQANEPAAASDLSEASLEEMMTLIRGARDSRGLRIQLKGQMLVIPAGEEFNAHRILNSVNQSGNANNDINAMRDMGMLPGGVVVWDFLTDVDAWFVKTDLPEGMIRQERMAVSLEQDNDFDTKNACMSAIERFGGGWADWRGMFGNPGV